MPPKVSVIIPTFNRPELLKRSVASVLAQTYQDLEVIIVDDGDKIHAREVAQSFHDPRIVYIENDPPKRGGGASRNIGIAHARGIWIAFQDDDDEWFPDKLALQIDALSHASPDVGFCFTAVENDQGDKQVETKVAEGVFDYRDIALRRFAGFLTITLVFPRRIFDEVGGFDESLPSHQEPELMIRVTRKYKGLGIDRPLARVNMTPHEHIGGDLSRRIAGREIIVRKHYDLLVSHPKTLAYHYFQIGLWCRESGKRTKAKIYFWKAFRLSGNLRYLAHWVRCIIF